ncbi:hypothetical protein [Rhizosaccharibacter radicis]|uniref:WD40 repeat domain-containing protein n=1 Tax=Rhizosaccharibacter radicis TaxID=2782605 RepID=A0ABT1VWP7_9PROT|nr:hypothetical protein [Acetobacteraceae bacterium KSS12]
MMTTRTTRAMLALVILMGVLILAGTTALIAVVAHRLTHRTPAPVPPASPSAEMIPAPPGAAFRTPLVLAREPAGSRILALSRQSDTLIAVAVTGGGEPDRVVVWDLAAARIVAELQLGPTSPAP